MSEPAEEKPPVSACDGEQAPSAAVCPVCGAALVSEKCKLVCRSEACVYRIVFNCAEF
ncbi:MAG TPA: hypothetical protein PKE26_06605 [Kiritimatiellia bacterium]|nr:hypothetical protein [Kiritimatiellia bacterium]HMO98765.1 hypothetical protein [Kiritimatiellia bacterium]HMP95941.1 hypothetical protein [Kiritimatiellia bacterium]